MSAVVPLLPEYAKDRWVLRGRLYAYLGGGPGATSIYNDWFRLACVRPFTITVQNPNPSGPNPVAMTSIRILVSNAYPSAPNIGSRNATFAALGPDITVPQSIIYDAPFEWITAVMIMLADPVAVDLAAG